SFVHFDLLLYNIDNVQCTREDDRERCELDIQGRGCNEEVYPWTMTERCVRRMQARRESRSWSRQDPISLC
ncbi:Os05g0269000, partial [Oryza sativa Japonica Group]